MLLLPRFEFAQSLQPPFFLPLLLPPDMAEILLSGHPGNCLVAGQLLLQKTVLVLPPLPNILDLVLNV